MLAGTNNPARTGFPFLFVLDHPQKVKINILKPEKQNSYKNTELGKSGHCII